jgi:DNA topoisomerase-1
MSGKYLVILESPNKIKNVQSYLGPDYIVAASVGHFRTLGTVKELGINIDNNYEPTYNIDSKKKDVVKNLKQLAKKCQRVYIATDYDREGEAIGWHICDVLGLNISQTPRLIFKEITKKALTESLKSPAKLDMNMVHSQQARMVLDKLLGYSISPALWTQFSNYKLSAGRVQSVVVKLINEREVEINNFESSGFYRLMAGFTLNKDKINSKKLEFDTQCETDFTDVNEVSNIISNTDDGLATFWIDDLNKKDTKRKPSPPFTTSTLQQEASNKLGMSPDRCMKVAQKLYEAGKITYMRTDSVMLSDEAVGKIAGFVKNKYGDNYFKKTSYTKKQKGAQEAHEACRPTDINLINVEGVNGLDKSANSLYKLIWKRTVACQMTPADVEVRTIKFKLDDSNCSPSLDTKTYNNGKSYTFISKFEKITFDGFLKVYGIEAEADDDDDELDNNKKLSDSKVKKLEKLFNSLEKGQQVWCGHMNATEQETKSKKARFTEASLIKELEKKGIGRPSTYASIVKKIQDREYVEKKTIPPKNKEFKKLIFNYPNDIEITSEKRKVGGEKNKLFITPLGSMVNAFLCQKFIDLMDYKFTADVEKELDIVSDGSIIWYNVVDNVYQNIKPILDQIKQSNKDNKSNYKNDKSTDNDKKWTLGKNPLTDNDVIVIQTRYGWSVCESNTVDKKKSRWASLGTLNPKDITLEQALKMLVYPKNLGLYNSHKIELKKAKNIYISYNKKNYSIENYNKINTDEQFVPEDLNKEQAIKIIDFTDNDRNNNEKLRNEVLKIKGAKNYEIRNGKYGYYIKYNDMYNIPLPAKYKSNTAEITKEICDKSVQKFLAKKKL